MERRHTPVPWGDQNKTVLLRGATWLGHANWDDAEAKANASLIAAAPDLLHALLCLKEWVDDHAVKPSEISEMQTAIAAIAKAEGRA